MNEKLEAETEVKLEEKIASSCVCLRRLVCVSVFRFHTEYTATALEIIEHLGSPSMNY